MDVDSQALDEGIRRFEEGNPADAIPLLEEAVGADPSNVRAHQYLGEALSKMGDSEGAIPHFVEAADLEPGEVKHSLNLGMAYAAAGKASEAAAAYRRVLSADPENTTAKEALAEITGAGAPAAPISEAAPVAESAPLSGPTPPPTEERSGPYLGGPKMGPMPEAKSGGPVKAIVALLVIAAIAAAGYFVVLPMLAGDPAKVVQQYAEAQKTLDFAALAKVTSASSQAQVAEMKAQVEGNPMAKQMTEMFKQMKMEAGKATVKGDAAEVELTVSMEKPTKFSQTQMVWCVKESGGWKVDLPKTQAEQQKKMQEMMGGRGAK